MADEVNPPTSEILSKHELASRTINQHNTPLAIFDQGELDILRNFVADPSETNQVTVLKNAARGDMYDGPDAGDKVGAKASSLGSLAGYVVARYGKADDKTLNAEEVEALKEWFDNGGGQE